jgi:S-adenosylmethionine hydrolase
MVAFPVFRAPVQAGEVFGRVLRVDRFGNLITDIRRETFIRDHACGAGREFLARTYGGAAGIVGIIGSSGYLEVALPKGSAADALQAGKGTPVVCITHSGRR